MTMQSMQATARMARVRTPVRIGKDHRVFGSRLAFSCRVGCIKTVIPIDSSRSIDRDPIRLSMRKDVQSLCQHCSNHMIVWQRDSMRFDRIEVGCV